jgi:hypothetical protein
MSIPSTWSDLPSDLSAALAAAWTALEAHPRGELPLPYRRAIWEALGPPHGDGYRRRVALSQLAVRHVLPLWDAEHPDDDGPHRMLALADRLVRGEADPQAARREQDAFAVEVQDLDDEDLRPGYVGDAAVDTVSTARIDYGPEDFEPDRLDEQLDADQWDASYYAALASAGKGPREPGDTTETQSKRRDFWRWYLTEAVPAAYHHPA